MPRKKKLTAAEQRKRFIELAKEQKLSPGTTAF
jgi:hypothetical protein